MKQDFTKKLNENETQKKANELLKTGTTQDVKICVAIPKQLLTELKIRIAKEDKLTIQAFVTRAIENELKNN